MPLKWNEVTAKKEYQELPDSDKAQTKLQYFYDVVAPQVPEEEVISVRSEFLNDVARQEIKQNEQSWLKELVIKPILKLPERATGIGLGAVNSPLAFTWGALEARELDKEQYDKLPTWKQALISGGAGIESAFKSTFKEGEWGTLYGEYYKSVKGKTIEEDLPEGLKWAAPTLEFVVNIASDPIISASVVKNLARFKLPKNWIGKIPDKVVKDIEAFEKLDQAEIAELQGRITEAIKNRTDYMKKWQDTVAFTKQQHKIKQAEVIRQRGLKGEPLLEGERDPFSTMTAPRQAMVGQPKDFGIQILEREEPALSELIKTTPKLGKKGVSPEAIKAMEEINRFRAEKGLSPLGKVPTEEFREAERLKATQKMEEFRKTKGLPSLMKLRAEGGALAGIEEDEDGNISYDPMKGLMGVAGAMGGVKIVDFVKNKKALQTLSNYPAWAKVASGIGKEKHIWTVPEVLQKMNVTLFDRFGVLKKASPKTYDIARAFSSYKDQALMKFRPLVEAFLPVKKDNFVLSSYVKAHRDMTRIEKALRDEQKAIADIKQSKPGSIAYKEAKQAYNDAQQLKKVPYDTKIYDKPPTLDEVKESIRNIETEWISKGKKLDDLQSTLDVFNQWTHDEILYPAYDAGFISKAGYDDIVKNNKWYATYDVIEHLPENIDNIPILASKEFFSDANQNIIKSMKGTEKKIIDPIEATIHKFTLAQYSIARNKVASALIDDPNMSQLIRPIATSKKEFGIMQNQGLNPFMEGGVNKREWGTINRFKDGNVERYAVPKEIADSMKQLTIFQAPRIIQAYNSIFRATATTLSPAFLIRNAPRDAFLGYISSPYHTAVTGFVKFPYDWGKGAWEAIKHELGKPSLVDDYINAGGSFGWAGSEAFEGGGKQVAKKLLFDKSLLRKTADVITSPFRLTAKLNEIVEMAPRLGIFDRGMKLGYEIEDAAMAGRQATIDFNRGGTFMKMANQFIPFLNARVQAKVTLYDAIKRDPNATLSKLVTSVMIPGVSAYAWNRLYFSDLYDDIPDYIRKDNFCFIYGSKPDEKTGKVVPKYIAIPKGDAGTLFNPIEFGIDKVLKENKKGATEFLINFLSDISPVEFAREGELSGTKVLGAVTPPIAKGFLEDQVNLKLYQGREIVPYYPFIAKGIPKELQYKDTTPESYKWLAKKMGWTGIGTLKSPLRLQNMASNLFTTYGRIGFSPQAMVDTIKGAIVKSEGGEIQNQAFVAIKNIENGYNTARAYSDKLIEEGDTNSAIKLINKWNNGLEKSVREYNKEFSKYGYQDQGGLMKSYYFTREKRRNILLKKESTFTALEKKLIK